MAETSSEEEAQQLRVKNMQALLKWSAAQDTTGDGASACASNAQALTHSSCLCTLQEHHPTITLVALSISSWIALLHSHVLSTLLPSSQRHSPVRARPHHRANTILAAAYRYQSHLQAHAFKREPTCGHNTETLAHAHAFMFIMQHPSVHQCKRQPAPRCSHDRVHRHHPPTDTCAITITSNPLR